MDLLQTAMEHHLGRFGVIFIAATLFLFSFSTFLGILFYARCNVAYLFGDNWASQTAYKVLALVMLFIGGLAAYTFVWDLGDVGIGLMTIFNIIILYPQGEKALKELKEYEKENEKHKEEAFETMSVVIVYGSGMFCDNQCQDDNGAGIIADVQIKWQNLYGKA